MNELNPKTSIGSLSYAILFGSDFIAEMLIEAGAKCYYDMNDQAKDFSPIFVAVLKEKRELIELMSYQSQDMYFGVKNAAGMTPLMFAAEQN